ncbi:formate dehydrogenase [Pseudooceanicola sediminis]|uniref:Formate dehydrogenase n=1 Tax=Pseudooceanicola sediminis TaxID=2211117 RepID=A0A399J7F9_9RHOB|nr:formate dehydrogenase subunit delta [Pseudooceanicola sediminis]KAA2313868.1 formate dehydrogenase subunit delta [Puniceibacterium sp. HSS470]RII38686.1 formate dehydrogenase [Pseudooceanicola sediminis]|tara:strand:- start:56402 stop:56629 length:228 start_codon:yes stop_codon:yes gene_type:complete
MSPEKMVMMANQIATFFRSQPGDDQPERIAEHLNDFWAPRMRAQFLAHVRDGGQGCDPLVVRAAAHVRAPVVRAD